MTPIPFIGSLDYLQIVDTLYFRLLETTRVNYYTIQDGLLAKTAYDDFYKDKSCSDHHGCSYMDHMMHIIDEHISQADTADQRFQSKSFGKEVQYCYHYIDSFVLGHADNPRESSTVKILDQGCNSQPRYDTVRDFYVHTKTVGYLALESRL